MPLLARLETGLLGVSPWTLRLLPTLVGGGLVALSGAYVRRLGGSLQLQAIALMAAVTAPFFLGANWLFQTVTFDQATWMVSLYWLLCLLTGGPPRCWIYLGVSLGIGLEVKYTIVGLIAGIGLAVLLTPSLRADLRTRYPWIGFGITVLIWAPNLVWQVGEGFPSLAYVTNHRGTIASGGGPAVYLIEIVVFLIFLLPLWVAGLVSLFRSGRLRPLGIAAAFPLLLFLLVGKSYYAAGTVPPALAQGLIATSHLGRPRLRASLQVAIVVASVLQLVTFAEITLPITPPDRLRALGLDTKSEVLADSVGWDEIAREVTSIYDGLPPSERSQTVIVSAYYGVPGALQVYDAPAHRPPAFSPQLSDWYWLPADLDARTALMVDYQPSQVTWMCESPQLIYHLTVPYQVRGLEQGAPVTLCPLKGPIPKVWPRLRDFS